MTASSIILHNFMLLLFKSGMKAFIRIDAGNSSG